MKSTFAAALSVAVLAGVFLPSAAEACGGFFCQTVPIDQAGERIAFSVDGDKVEAHVQIQYTGDAKQFSWVVPVHALPELSIGTPQLFTFLSQATQPRFFLTFENDMCGFFGSANASRDGAPTSAEAGGSGVNVVSREDVGPYDAVILQASEATALTNWLKDNGYNLTDAGAAALVPYVAPGYYFVALKLQQDKSIGDLRPIVLKMQGVTPCVPIRLTAIAATPNMPIIAYVFAAHRAAPQNYRHVLINETKVDWMLGGFNYSQVASAAVDEAGGKAFLTEFAAPVSTINPAGFSNQYANYDTEALKPLTDPIAFWQAMTNQGLMQDASTLGLLRKYIPMPKSMVDQGYSDLTFYNAMTAFREELEADTTRAPFTPVAFAEEIEASIVAPMKAAAKLFDRPYLTRLYTTMSAEEMDIDPEFHFNPDLPDVSNLHRATATLVSGCTNFSSMTYKIQLQDGRWFYQSSSGGAVSDGPNAERIEMVGTSGAPVVLVDNGATINKVLGRIGGGSGSGCSCQSVDLGGTLLGLLALSSRLLRRRRS